jgi:5-methyltetrahydrofolate--homocysteine methyltransferase
MARNDALFTAVGKGKRNDVQAQVQALLGQGVPAEEILMDTMIAARAMQAGLTILEPILAKKGHQPIGKVCVGTVKGDLHDIGKNLVVMMLKGAGYEVMDLGVDCGVEKFEQGVAQGATVVLCSALLTTTMPYMKQVVDHFRGRAGVQIVIGGAPVTQQYAEEIGAHGYGSDANDAVRIVEKLLGRK